MVFSYYVFILSHVWALDWWTLPWRSWAELLALGALVLVYITISLDATRERGGFCVFICLFHSICEQNIVTPPVMELKSLVGRKTKSDRVRQNFITDERKKIEESDRINNSRRFVVSSCGSNQFCFFPKSCKITFQCIYICGCGHQNNVNYTIIREIKFPNKTSRTKIINLFMNDMTQPSFQRCTSRHENVYFTFRLVNTACNKVWVPVWI